MQRSFSIKTSGQVMSSQPWPSPAEPGTHPVGFSWELQPRNAQPGLRASRALL